MNRASVPADFEGDLQGGGRPEGAVRPRRAATPGPAVRRLGAVALPHRRDPAACGAQPPPPGARRLPRGRDVGGVEVDVGVRQQHGLHPPRAQHLLAEAAAQHGHAPVLEGAAAGRHGGRPPPGRAGPGPAAAAPRSRAAPSAANGHAPTCQFEFPTSGSYWAREDPPTRSD